MAESIDARRLTDDAYRALKSAYVRDSRKPKPVEVDATFNALAASKEDYAAAKRAYTRSADARS